MALTKTHNRMIKDSQFNIVDFGAIGDGVTDNTSAIQAAIDACRTAGGGDVIIPTGTFLIGSTINLIGTAGQESSTDLKKQIVNLRGYSQKDSILYYTGNSIAIYLYGIYGTTSNLIEDLTIKGNGKISGSIGIHSSIYTQPSSHHLRVNRCNITEFNIGLYIEHMYGGVISNCRFRYNTKGLQLGEDTSTTGLANRINGNRFIDNEFSYNDIGIQIFVGDQDTFKGGLIESNEEEAIIIDTRNGTVDDVRFIEFEDIWFEANQKSLTTLTNAGGIRLQGPGIGDNGLAHIGFTRCKFNTGSFHYAFYLGNTKYLNIIDCVFYGSVTQWFVRPGGSDYTAGMRVMFRDNREALKFKTNYVDTGVLRTTTQHMHAYEPSSNYKTFVFQTDGISHTANQSKATTFCTTYSETFASGTGTATSGNIRLPDNAYPVYIGVWMDAAATGTTSFKLVTITDDNVTTEYSNWALSIGSGSQGNDKTLVLSDFIDSKDYVNANQRAGFYVNKNFPNGTTVYVTILWRWNDSEAF